jgi:NAD+ diphosphatase
MLDAGPDAPLFAPVKGAIAHRLLRDWIEWER